MARKLKVSPDYCDFFNRLIELCNENNTSTSSVIGELTSSTSASTAWKKGNININLIPRLAEKFNVSISYLVSGCEETKPTQLRGNQNSSVQQQLIKLFEQLPKSEQGRVFGRVELLAEYYKSIQHEKNQIQSDNQVEETNVLCRPIFDLPAVAGVTNPLEGSYFNVVKLKYSTVTEASDYILRVSGDSMLPEYHDNDLVLVKMQPFVEQGQVGIFFVDGSGYIKKFGGDSLISLNPQYPNIDLSKSDNAYCQGLVLSVVDNDDIISIIDRAEFN